MTRQLKTKVLLSILQLAPMGSSQRTFAAFADRGDLDGFWTHYLHCIAARSDIRANVELAGRISFEMLRPAMDAVFALPER